MVLFKIFIVVILVFALIDAVLCKNPKNSWKMEVAKAVKVTAYVILVFWILKI